MRIHIHFSGSFRHVGFAVVCSVLGRHLRIVVDDSKVHNGNCDMPAIPSIHIHTHWMSQSPHKDNNNEIGNNEKKDELLNRMSDSVCLLLSAIELNFGRAQK